jgi:hypothetical protein
LSLAQSFGVAKLDLGEDLPAVVERLIEQVGAANAGDDGPAAMLGFVADLVKQVNGDAFALFSCFEETSVGVPDDAHGAAAFRRGCRRGGGHRLAVGLRDIRSAGDGERPCGRCA